MHKHVGLAIVAAVLAGAAQAGATPIFFDDFSIGQPSVSNDGVGGSSIIGMPFALSMQVSRTLEADISANTDPSDARIRTAIHGGEMTVSNDFEVTGLGSSTYTFASPVNFTSSQSFQVDFLSNDLPATVGIVSTDSHAVQSTVFVTLPAGPTPFSITINNVFAANDATSISKLALVFGGTAADDAAVTSIESVPEPVSAGLLGIAGLGLLRRRRQH